MEARTAQAATTWHVLRKYVLNSSHNGAWNNHLMVNGIQEFGKGGTTLFNTQTFTYDAVPANGSRNNIRMKTADNGNGGKITYTYGGPYVTQCASSCGDPYSRYPLVTTVTDDGMGNTRQSSFAYPTLPKANNGGDFYEFMGYAQGIIRHYGVNSSSTVLRSERVDFEQGSQTAPSPLLGREKERKIYQGDLVQVAGAVPLSTVTNTWSAHSRAAGANWTTANPTGVTWSTRPLWLRLDSTTSVINGATNQQKFYYDVSRQNGTQYGNVTRVEEYGAGASPLRTTLTTFYPNTGSNIVNQPARVQIRAGGETGTCKAESRMIYDAANLEGSYQTVPTTNLLVKAEQALTSCPTTVNVPRTDAAWAITRMTYDTWGNPTKVTRVGPPVADNSNDHVIVTSYDSIYHLFPVSRAAEGVSGYTETATYYGVNAAFGVGDSRAVWGAMSEFCGVNEACTRQSYDFMGRPLRRWENAAKGSAWANDSGANTYYLYNKKGDGSGSNRYVVTEWHSPRCYGNLVRRHYNGLGQLIQEQRPDQSWQFAQDGCGTSPGTGSYNAEIDVDYAYDGLGRQSKVSVPHKVTTNSVNRAANFGAGQTFTTFDALDRPTQMTAPNGEVTLYYYNGRDTKVVGQGRNGDPDKLLSWQVMDDLGRLISTRSGTGSGSSWTQAGAVTLGYDITNNLTSVTNAAGGTSTMTYDFAGRKTAMADSDLGNWSYIYDRHSHLTRQTDACGNQTFLSYTYKLDRLSGKTFVKGTNAACNTPAVAYNISYTYDTGHSSSNRSRGQLTQVKYSDNSYQKDLTYNGFGLPASTKVTIAGGATGGYTTSYAYDMHQRPLSTTYPDGEKLTTNYNGMGLPNLLTSSLNTTTPIIPMVAGETAGGGIANGVNYNEAMLPTQMKFPLGGNLWRTNSYYGWTGTNGDANRRLNAIKVGLTAGAGERLNLTYNYDTFANIKTLNESYNNSASAANTIAYDVQNRVTSAFGKSYGYDNAGRMTSYEGTTNTFNTTVPRQGVKNTGYGYDANGNAKTRPGSQTLVWNVENRLHSVAGEQYLYDENGIRIKKTVGATTTFYPFGHYEVSGTTVKKYYTFGGMTIAMRTGSTLQYLHTDHLGGVAAVTTSAGVYSTNQSYFAYGKKRAGGTLPTTINYTGQRLDGSGLVYMNARYYDPLVGMFISPDTIVPDAGVLIDYNRFAYARGNSLKYNDPSGHCPVCILAVVLAGAALVVPSDTPLPPEEAEKYAATGKLGAVLITGGTAAYFAPALLPVGAQAACRDGDCTNEATAVTNAASNGQRAANAAQSVWQMRPFDRGVAIENMLGRSPNLVDNFPTIDRFQSGVATSIKSIDLTAKSYQNINTLTRTVQGYVNKMAQWQGQPSAWGGVTIDPSQITSRVVELAIPPGATQAQLNALQQVQQNAMQVGVQLSLISIR